MHIRNDYSTAIKAPVNAVWALLRDFDDATWHPAVLSSTPSSQQDGSHLRILTLTDGRQVRERLAVLDEHARRLVYEFVDPAPLPVTSSRIVLQVTATPTGHCTVTWQGDFEVADEATATAVTHINTATAWPSAAERLRHAATVTA